MFKPNLIAAAVALACASAALAQDADSSKIREELKQMKDDYEQRVRALEKRVSEAEATAGKSERGTPAGAVAGRSGESAFNPAISLILQGTYANTSQDPETYQITGFVPSGGEVGPPKRSFGLDETELVVSANVDPYFRGHLVAALTPENEVEVEEAYFQTLALGKGFTLKGGRYFSGIGYQNEIHQHAWDFQDAPLPYKAFLGGQLKQDGLQLRWVAPTPFFLELGAEATSGDQFPGSDRNKNGTNGGSVFGHVGGDIGPSYAWRAGVSYLKATAQDRPYEDVDSVGGAVTNSFTGDAKLWIVDAILKWAPNGNPARTNFKLQGEYFSFEQDGTLTYDDTGGTNAFGTVASSFATDQSGWYAQGVWQFMPRWRVGYRYDRLDRGTVTNGIVNNGLGPTAADFPVLADHNPSRNTVMIDWSPSEFSRLRVQYASDESRIGVTDRVFIVQYIMSLGAHGAHKF
ncbi:MAG TPA: TonB-dependent receptor [Burkholderiales bacterium]